MFISDPSQVGNNPVGVRSWSSDYVPAVDPDDLAFFTFDGGLGAPARFVAGQRRPEGGNAVTNPDSAVDIGVGNSDYPVANLQMSWLKFSEPWDDVFHDDISSIHIPLPSEIHTDIVRGGTADHASLQSVPDTDDFDPRRSWSLRSINPAEPYFLARHGVKIGPGVTPVLLDRFVADEKPQIWKFIRDDEPIASVVRLDYSAVLLGHFASNSWHVKDLLLLSRYGTSGLNSS